MSTMHITDLRLFNLLKNKLGEKEAEAVTNYATQEVDNSNKKTIEFFNQDISNLREHIDEKFKTQEQTMLFKIEQLRSDNYKVTFWSSVIQILTIVGCIVAITKF